MTVHDLGYRGWSGELTSPWIRSVVIARTGVQRVWQSRWLRRMVFFAWLPAMWFGMGFFIWEQSLLYPEWREGLEPFLLEGLEESNPVVRVLRETAEEPASARHAVWAWLLQSFFRYPQGVLMMLVVGLIAPSLISQDIRSRAFLLYFSRPLTRREYIAGKFATVVTYLVAISTVPALCLYVLGILLSPQLEVVRATWDLPLRILAASAVLTIPTASLALCLSSATQESRYAGFAWFAIWILGWFTYGVMRSLAIAEGRDALTKPVRGWDHLSLYHTLGQVETWVFGFTPLSEIWTSAIILCAITVVSLVVLFRNVAAPMRA
jgi:ABC-type transport system involved in multi-copper enzyme maturation permease subunit